MALSQRMKNVAPSGIRRVFDLSQGMRGVINLGIGEPDFEVPQHVRDALKEAADHGSNKYTGNRGIPELRAEIAKKLRRENGVDADPAKQIIVTAGTTQAIFALMNVLLDRGDEVVIPTPAFPAYKAAVMLAGGRPVEVPTREKDGYRLDSRKVEKAFTKRTKLLVVNSPSNPTGAVFPKEQVTGVCAAAVAKGLYVLSDEIYEKFVYDGASHFSPASAGELRKKVVTVSGLSKTFAITGWRLGFAAASEEVIDAMTRFNMYNAVCASSVVQAAGVAALRGPLGFLGPVLKEYDRRRTLVCKGLREAGMELVEPRGAFYVFPRIGGKRADSDAFSAELLSRFRVATIPGGSFGRGGEGHIRISYATSEQNLLKALDRLRKFMK